MKVSWWSGVVASALVALAACDDGASDSAGGAGGGGGDAARPDDGGPAADGAISPGADAALDAASGDDAAHVEDASRPDATPDAVPSEADGTTPEADSTPPEADGTPPEADGTPPEADGAPPAEDARVPPDAAPDAAPDPCADFPCAAPPPAFCEGDVRVASGPGRCVAEGDLPDCEYPEVREPCGVGRACQGGACVITAAGPVAGEIEVTEILYDPAEPLADEAAEWVELHNLAAEVRSLDDCALAEADRSTRLAGLVVEAGAYAIVARSADPGANGGLDAAAAFDFDLGDDAGHLRVVCGADSIAEAAWDEAAGWPDARAAAISREPGGGDGPDGWCLADLPYFGEGAGTHFGTPGAANPACPVPDTTVDACRLVVPLDLQAGAGTSFDLVGRVLEAGITDRGDGVDLHPALRAEAGFGPRGRAPDGFTWLPAEGAPEWSAAAAGAQGEDEYRVRTRVPAPGDYDVAFRFSRDAGLTFTYCDVDGGDYDRPGRLRSAASPCSAMDCDVAPPPACEDGVTRLVQDGPGECVDAGGGACVFRETRTDCTDLGGECLQGDCLGAWPRARSGDVVFTEILYDAAGPLNDDGGEWFEIQNVADGPRLLHGCRLEDASNVEVLNRVLMQPGEILLFAHTEDAMLNGGIDPDLLFEFGLGNDGDTLTIRCGDVVVDSVSWGAGFPAARKESIALDAGALDAEANDDGASWCLGRERYYRAPTPDDDHRGTPGAPNPLCDAPSCEPNPCFEPPPDECADDRTVRRFAPEGACDLLDDGVACDYAEMPEACPGGRVCRRGACVLPDRQPPLEGEVVFTEIMPDPAYDLADDAAEWFELHNRTGGRLTLEGCEIEDGSGLAEPLVGGLIEPRGYLLFTRNADRLINGGLRPDHTFVFRLGASGDRLRLRCGGRLIDQVDYDGFRTAEGRALSLDPGALDAMANDRADAWCLARAAYYRDPDGDNLGTPRAANPACAVPVGACRWADVDRFDASAFQILPALGVVQVAGVTDRTPRTDPAADLRGQLGLSRAGATTRWFDAVPDPAWDAAAAGEPGFDRYRADFVVPATGSWDAQLRFTADGGFTWTQCPGGAVVEVRDGDPCVGPACAPTQPGEVVINEVMYDPQFALDDASAEWIELYNASVRPVDLAGCVLADDPEALDALIVGEVALEPGAFALFARSAARATNGGLAPIQTFDFALSNAGDAVVLVCDGVEIDGVRYDDGPDFPDAAARSLSLDPGALEANDLGASWCLGATPYFRDPVGADRDNHGTPGAPNPPCP